MKNSWDCIVVGAGAAGLSAALVLGRARRRTLVVDAGKPSNAVAAGIGGLLGSNERPPADYYAAGRAEALAHPTVEIRTGEVTGAGSSTDGLVLELADGNEETTRRVLLATGMEYRTPDVPGIRERFGRSVFHCPFCHGWEVRDRSLAVLDGGPMGVERALLLRSWSDDVTLLTDGPAQLGDERARLRSAGVAVDERGVSELRGPGTDLEEVAFDDGAVRRVGGLLVPVTLHQRSTLAGQLGATEQEPGPVAADALEIDPMYHTSAPGVWAAGDVSTQMPSVAGAVAAGSTAAGMIVRDLMVEPDDTAS